MMPIDKILFYLFLAGLISSFLPTKAYVAIFLLFSLFSFVHLSLKLKVKMGALKPILWGTGFLSHAIVICMCNLGTIDPANFAKLIINILFFLSFLYYIYNCEIQKIYAQLFFGTILTIIAGSFLQILMNAFNTNAFMLLFKGVSSSVEANTIANSPVYFGSSSKNIWATKVCFIELICLFSCFYVRPFLTNKNRCGILIMICIFNILMISSRTAIIAFAIPLIYIAVSKARSLNNYLLKPIFFVCSVAILFIISFYLYTKHLHLTLDHTDGFFTRLCHWKSFILNVDKINIITGNGILYARTFIPLYSSFGSEPINNMHNVYLNMAMDFGLVGLFFYLGFLISIFKHMYNSVRKCGIQCSQFMVFVLVPFIVITNSQYLGYDNDIILFLSCLLLICKFRTAASLTASSF